MHFSSAFIVAAFAAPIFAIPTPMAPIETDLPVVVEPLQTRNELQVICKPAVNNSGLKSFKVDIAYSRSQANKAGFPAGLSGDPHRYMNGDGIPWGEYNCDKAGALLYEYPIYWVGTRGNIDQIEWQKEKKTSEQPKTPIRVVYANQNGSPIYCGIMTHSEVDAAYQGKAFFQKCD